MASSYDEIFTLLPLIILMAGSALTYFVSKVSPKKDLAAVCGAVASVVLAGALIQLVRMHLAGDYPDFTFYGKVVMAPSGIALLVSIVATAMGLLAALYSIGYMEGKENPHLFFSLLVLMVAGMVGIGFSEDLFNMYVAFELMSIASFALVAFDRSKPEPVEAGMKYIIMSGAGSALALVGISLVFATTGTTDLAGIRRAMEEALDVQGNTPLVGLLFMVAGFGVKAAMVPLHTWLPDAHSAAPSGISAMLSGIVIQAGLVALLKASLPFLHDSGTALIPSVPLGLALALMAVVTMSAGNLMALKQKDLKRMLAYSSIAQMGYIMMGVGLYLYMPTVAAIGIWGGMLHIITHAFMKGGAFLCAGAVIYAIGTRDIHEMRGIGRKHPFIGIAFTLFAFSLAGLPPLSGFVSELLLVRSGIDIAVSGEGIGRWALVFSAALVINNVISLGYYLPAVNKMMFSRGDGPKVAGAREIPISMKAAIAVMAGLTLLLGLYPDVGLWLVEPAVGYFDAFLEV